MAFRACRPRRAAYIYVDIHWRGGLIIVKRPSRHGNRTVPGTSLVKASERYVRVLCCLSARCFFIHLGIGRIAAARVHRRDPVMVSGVGGEPAVGKRISALPLSVVSRL